MGNSESCTLPASDLDKYESSSVFTEQEIKCLWVHFQSISDGEDKISRNGFQKVLLFRDTTLVDRIFRVFDKDEDLMISFGEFINCLSQISSKANPVDKLRLSFDIYDFDGDKMISTSDLTTALASTLRENDLIIEREQIDEIVALTMDEVSPDVPGMISPDEYEVLVAQRPQMLSRLSLNISGIIREYTAKSIH